MYAEETDNSDYMLICLNTITPHQTHFRSCCYIKVYIIPVFKENSMKKRKS